VAEAIIRLFSDKALIVIGAILNFENAERQRVEQTQCLLVT
jgi:hypothetical protein